jgi:uncharacterized protein YndB with AHSA1/START domain
MTDAPKLRMTRVIRATRQATFEAWTRPELMKKWYAPGAMSTPNASSDLRVGGSFHVEMKGEADGKPVNPVVRGTYTRIVQNELLSFTWSWDGNPSPQTTVTVEFRDVDGGTELTLTHEGFASVDARDRHEHGWVGCLTKLQAYLNA